jgi:hypothetical protein
MITHSRIASALAIALLTGILGAQTISSITPNDACFNGPQFTMTVNGSGYIHQGFGNTSTVRWNGTHLPTTYVSSSQLTATVAASYLDVAGVASITVINQHLIGPSTISNSVSFTVNAFAELTYVTPQVCADGTSATIDVYSGTPLTGYSVRWNNTTLSSSSAQYSGQYGYHRTATVPASQLNLPGSASVRLRSPDGCDSAPMTVTMVITPTIQSISPSWKAVGGAGFTLNVSGFGFPSGAQLRWNGIDLPTTFVNSTTLTATIDDSFLGRVGSGTISVHGGPCLNGDGAQTFDVIGPTMTSVSPTAIGVGASTVTLTVTGSGFTSSSDILFDGTILTTTFVSSTQITAPVPANLLATAGTKWVSVGHFYVGSPPQFAYSTMSKPFTVQGPTLQRLVPDHIPAGSSSFTLQVWGTSLHVGGALFPPTVRWNGTSYVAAVVDSSHLEITVPASQVTAAGTATIDVVVPQNPLGSKVTNALTFTIEPPGISTAAGGWTTEAGGVVEDVLQVGSTVYVGGNFDYIGPMVPGAAMLATFSGAPLSKMPAVGGTVNAVVEDGAGGWFIGGSFSSVGGFPRSNLARIWSNGMLDPYFNARTNGPVYDLSLYGTSWLYIGGDFSRVNEAPRHNAAAVDFAGALTGYNPCPNAPVTSIAAEGVYVLLIGAFTGVAGTLPDGPGFAPTLHGTGNLAAWSTSPGQYPSGATLARGDGSIFYLVADGELTQRDILSGNPTGDWPTHSVTGSVHRIVMHPTYLFIHGGVTAVNGQPRGRVASFDRVTGALQAFDPGADGDVTCLSHDGTYLYAGGAFTQFAGVEQRKLGSLLINFGTPSYLRHAENGTVDVLAASGGAVAVFGSFTSAGGAARKNLAAVDATTGAVLPNWQADVTQSTFSPFVYALAAHGSWLYVGGNYTAIDGQARSDLARVSLTTGAVDSWNPACNSNVHHFELGPQTMYLAGPFSQIGGVSRPGLAAIDLASGQVTSWTPAPHPLWGGWSNAQDLALSGSTLYVGLGLYNQNYTEIIRGIDTATGALTSFSTSLNGACISLAVDGDTLFAGGYFTAVNGLPSPYLAAIQRSTGALLPLCPAVNGVVNTLERSGATLFVGGDFTTVGGVSRPTLAAIDLGNGQLRPWAPAIGADGGSLWEKSFHATPTSLFLGGRFGSVNGVAQHGFARFAFGGPYPTPQAAALGTTTAPAGSGSLALVVQGSGFASGSAVRFGGVWVPTAFNSASQLTATIDASLLASAGLRDVDVVAPAPGAGVSSALQFSVTNPSPSATAIDPSSGPYGGAAFTLGVSGSGFTAQSIVRWNGADLPTTFQSGTSLQASVPASSMTTAGSASVTVFNPTPGGGTSGAVPFTVEYPVPSVSGLAPSIQLVGSAGFTLTISGGPFFATSYARWAGASLPTTWVNAATLEAQVSAGELAQAGYFAVDVVTPGPGGGTSPSQSFTVAHPVPACSTISPTGANAGESGFTLSVSGSSFVPTSIVRWSGAPLPTSYVSATTLHATVDQSLLANGGVIAVDVSTPAPGGGVSGAQTFTITNAPPTAASVDPASVTAGGPSFSVTVTGTGFNGTTVVRVNGAAVPTTPIDATHVSGTVDAASIATGGALAISVMNPAPGGGSSGNVTMAVLNPVPSLGSLTPDSATAGGPAFVLTLGGSSFVPTSVARWAGVPLATSFVSATQLQAAVPASFRAFGGSATMTVENPAPGGGASAGLPFSIVAPQVTSLSPSSTPPIMPGQPPLVITVSGVGFSPSSIVYVNTFPLSTFYSSANQLFATLPSGPYFLQVPGAVVISVLDGTSHSNGLPLVIGSGSNQGWIMKSPPNPAPGQAFAIVIEGAAPGVPFSLIADMTNPAPIAPFPSPAANEVLALDPGNTGLVWVLDGLGVVGPPVPVAFTAPPTGGRFVMADLIHPPPLGIGVTLQAVYPAPTPWGLHLTWGHFAMPF